MEERVIPGTTGVSAYYPILVFPWWADTAALETERYVTFMLIDCRGLVEVSCVQRRMVNILEDE